MNDEKITYFAETDARNKRVKFGIKAKDRTKHVYVIGKTGMGKSTLLENMAVQDIKNGEGMAFIDPHGKTADLLLDYIPPERVKDVIYFAPFDTDHPLSFNVLESVDPDKRHLVVSGLMSTFKKIWKDAWSARMEYILTNTLLALLEYPNATLLGVNRMLSDKKFRDKVVACVTDPAVRSFWVEEFANYTERMAAEAVPAIQNKIGQFTANSLIRNMIGQPKSSFDIRKVMDEKKIMIINLSKGRIGEVNTNLLGGMLITKIYLAALSRADVPDRVLKGMPNFYLFVDEFQSFANESFADILSEARKYKLNLTIAHQYIEQMEEEVRAAVFGNVGTMIVFRVGAYDAEVLEKEFAPQFTAEDIVNLGFTQIYLKLMIDGVSSSPFSATTLGPIPLPEVSNAQIAIGESRLQFALPRAEVEKNIADWMEPIAAPPKPGKGPAGTNGNPNVGPGPKPENRGDQKPFLKPPATQYVEQVHVPHVATAPQQTSVPHATPHVVMQPQAPLAPQPQTPPSHQTQQAPIQQQPQQPRPAPQAPAPQAPTHHQPFKVAIAQVQDMLHKNLSTAATPAKPVSLSSLSPKTSVKNVKEATPERVSDLKNALASVLKSKPAAAPASTKTDQAPVTPVAVIKPEQAIKTEQVPHKPEPAVVKPEPQPVHQTQHQPHHQPQPAPKKEPEQPKIEMKKEEPKTETPPQQPPQFEYRHEERVPYQPKEVSEDVLRSVLKVE